MWKFYYMKLVTLIIDMKSKMAVALDSTFCCAPNNVKNSVLNKLYDCTKCIELELQLQKLREELSSVQLIVELINKERIHNMAASTSTQEDVVNREEDETWRVKPYKSTTKRAEGNNNQRHLKSSTIETPAVATANRYSILETGSHVSQYDDETVNPHKEILTAVNNDPEKGLKLTAPIHPVASSIPLTNQDLGNVAKHNLQNCDSAYQSSDEGHKGTYYIPTIISERQSPGNIGWSMQQEISHQGTTHPNSMNETLQSERKKHKILIIGDSHVIGLSEKIIDRLDNSYSVLGIAQPNADIAAIISQTYLQVEDLTKEDIIIFLGGTTDINRNETEKGLRILEEFIQQTTNTNVILLGALQRYDLSPYSCVNTEVTLFNKRLHSFAYNSIHATILSVPTERSHHTRHGLHCNKKGKTWMADVIVQKIKHWNSLCEKSTPTELLWKEDVTNPGSQPSSLITSATEKYLTPNLKYDGNPDCLDKIITVDHQTQTEICLSPISKNGNNPGGSDNIANVDCQTQTELHCSDQIQMLENGQDEEITLCESTRLNIVKVDYQTQSEICLSPNPKNGNDSGGSDNIANVDCQTQPDSNSSDQIQMLGNGQDEEITLCESTKLNILNVDYLTQSEICLSPNPKNGNNPEGGDNIANVDCQTQTELKCSDQSQMLEIGQDEEITLRKSTRLKHHPSSKQQDFLY
jgi:hypothetical protein